MGKRFPGGCANTGRGGFRQRSSWGEDGWGCKQSTHLQLQSQANFGVATRCRAAMTALRRACADFPHCTQVADVRESQSQRVPYHARGRGTNALLENDGV